MVLMVLRQIGFGIRAEAKSLCDFGVYEEVQSSDVPSGTKILGSRIVLREKHGGVKARLRTGL